MAQQLRQHRHLEAHDESSSDGTRIDAAYRCVFLGVLAHAVREARGIRVDNCTDVMLTRRQAAALKWLTEGDEGFKEVCLLAGLNWQAALENFRRRFTRHHVNRRTRT